MKKYLFLACALATLGSNAEARYYERNNAYYEEMPRYKRKQAISREYAESEYYDKRGTQMYRRLSNEEARQAREKVTYSEYELPNKIRPYIGIDISNTRWKFNSTDMDYGQFIPKSSNAYSLNAGVKINKHIGIETFIQQSDEESKKHKLFYIKDKIDFNAIGLDIIGYAPFSQKLEFLASLGLAQYNFNNKTEYDFYDYIGREKSQLNTTGIRFGLGAQLNLTGNFALRVMARYIEPNDDDIIKNMMEISLGIRYLF